MKKSLVFAFLMTAATVNAQVPGYPTPGCPTCSITYGYMDGLEPSNVPVASVNQTWIVAGWGFNCYSGQVTDRIDVYYKGDDGFYKKIPTIGFLNNSVYRPDVAAVYAPFCPAVSSTTGVEIAVDASSVPVGVRDVAFVIWKGAFHTDPILYRVRFQ